MEAVKLDFHSFTQWKEAVEKKPASDKTQEWKARNLNKLKTFNASLAKHKDVYLKSQEADKAAFGSMLKQWEEMINSLYKDLNAIKIPTKITDTAGTSGTNQSMKVLDYQLQRAERLIIQTTEYYTSADHDNVSGKFHEEKLILSKNKVNDAIKECINSGFMEYVDQTQDKINQIETNLAGLIIQIRKSVDNDTTKTNIKKKFTGKITEYADCRKLVQLNILDNRAFKQPKQKLGALKAFTAGRPHKLINQIQLSKSGLDQALEILDREFRDDRKMHLQMLAKITEMKKCKDTSTDVQKYIDEFGQNMAALATVGIDISNE